MQHTHTSHHPNRKRRLIRRREVLNRIGVSSTTLWRMYRAGEFPSPIKIGSNSVAWDEAAVDAWIDERASKGA